MGFFASQSQRTSLSPYHFSSSSSLSFSSSSPMPRNHRFSFFLFLFLNSSVFFFIPCFSVNDQGQALLSWKSQLNISGDALSSWNAAESNPCKWVGIRCNARGQVSEIQLQVTDFQGPLPATNLLQLKSLTSLRLTSVNLTGFIPKELGDLPELEVLDLADNSLSGEIPVEIFKLKKLKTLSLNTNNLEGAIPSELGNLTNLVELTLFDNKLAGEIPKSIGELKNLQTFRAGGNKNLRGELPWEIGNCESLVTLGLAETSLSGKLPASIGNLKHVQTIALYTSLFSGPIPDEIGNCTELQNLYLYQNSISGSIPTTLGGLKNLQSLLLWQNNLVGKIPVELGNCPDLFLIDLSENLLTGNIPRSFGNLPNLQELQLSVNQLSGTIPEELANCTKLTHLEIDNNRISGEIPQLKLTSLTMFFAWSNQLTGKIPESLSQCEELQAIDLSYNALSGSIPNGIFDLRNLTKLLLLSNSLSGSIPPEIGNCTSLYRLRLNGNRLAGNIPSEIGNLKNLNFIDISENRLAGNIPPAISGCESLEFLDLHSNGLTGSLPGSLPKSLQFIDFSDNSLTGSLPSGIGSLTELTKLNLAKNRLSGSIPREISSCRSLQLLNLGDNSFTGDIPDELGRIPSLAISLNLSCNSFSGVIPSRFSSLVNLGTLDVSHNKLAGNLNALADLQNLVSLNISFNEFSGELPNTLFFRKLPLSVLEPNRGLFISTRPDTEIQTRRHRSAVKLAMSILVAASVVLVLMAVYTLVKAQRVAGKQHEELDTWEVTLYQKLDFSVDDIVKNLTSANVIGTGSSGVVYRVTIPSGETLAVKKMWSKEETGAFNSEINTLGSIRHRNIIRLLGWCSNKNLKLLFYDYLPNGSLSSLLHGAGKGRGGADWEARYDVVLGVAHALAYLHHDCLPPILHGDVKAMNVLLGSRFEPFLADFGLAKPVSCGENNDVDSSKSSNRPPLAGSYGYMAPEHASMQRITEKSDVYSFGVVLLEVLTGKHPLDPDLPGGAHLVQWVRDHLAKKKAPGEILDPRLRGRADPIMHEMLQTLAVAFLCVSNKAADRPMMKDIVAMLKEIRQLDVGRSENDMLKGGKCEKWQPQPLPPEKFVTPRGSSNCSFAFSDESV